MLGCCAAAGRKYKTGKSDSKSSTLSVVARAILRARVPYPLLQASSVDQERLAIILKSVPPDSARKVRSCKCPCHVDGIGVLC